MICIASHDQILRHEAELGNAECQRKLASILLQSTQAKDLVEAYKWLFISHALGNQEARADLVPLHEALGSIATTTEYESIEEWFGDKYDQVTSNPEFPWAKELIEWCFKTPCVH